MAARYSELYDDLDVYDVNDEKIRVRASRGPHDVQATADTLELARSWAGPAGAACRG
jgi:hypothetical protein